MRSRLLSILIFSWLIPLPSVVHAQDVAAPQPIGAGYDPFTDFFTAAEPPSVFDTAKPGEPLLRVAVTYRHTGVLAEEVRSTAWLGVTLVKPVPVGTPVFGLRATVGTGIEPDPDLMWCSASLEAPQPDKPWSVTCFAVARLLGFHKLKMASIGADYFPDLVNLRDADPATPVKIDVKPVDLHPPLSIVYQFAGWDHGQANFRVLVRRPARFSLGNRSVAPDYMFGRIHLDKDALGAAHLKVLGGELLVRPAPDGRSALAQLAQPFSEAPADLPADGSSP